MSPPSDRQTGTASPIDFAFLAEQTAGDRALQAELLALFARQARDILERVGAMGEGSDRVLLLHTLDGSARAVGARDVATEAQRLEQDARAGTWTGCSDALRRSVAAACAAIEGW